MPSYRTDEQRWQAVQQRDKAADTEFFYGVSSTGIFCYPSCPSKTSLEENTRFFNSRAEAVAADYRPCQRCRSDEAPLSERQQQLVEQACRIIEDTQSTIKIEQLATHLSVSRYHLQKLFQQYLGLSPKAYIKATRAKLMELALANNTTVTDAVYESGYDSASTFYATDGARLGMSAKQYQQNAKGLTIEYGFGTTRFGKIIVAVTDKGVCCILFGETQKSLLADLQTRFRHAQLHRHSKSLDDTIRRVINSIDSPDSADVVPLDIQGTAFQEKVWQALLEIPCGSTATYSEIATKIGKPKASRAVATACAANPLAVVVPCHRVVRASGELSGYRWGVDRKKKILDHEKEVINPEKVDD